MISEKMHFPARRRGRVVEGAPLLREYTSKGYRGFESLRLRHFPVAQTDQDLSLKNSALVMGV